jgi:hypothetical protein
VSRSSVTYLLPPRLGGAAYFQITLLLIAVIWRSCMFVLTCDMWHATCDMRHATCDMWHVTCDADLNKICTTTYQIVVMQARTKTSVQRSVSYSQQLESSPSTVIDNDFQSSGFCQLSLHVKFWIVACTWFSCDEHSYCQEFAKAVEMEHLKGEIIPLFNSLANDEQVKRTNKK